MSEMQKYNHAMDAVHAPESLVSEVLNLTVYREQGRVMHPGRRLVILAAALVLMLAIGLTAYAAGTSLFGWKDNFEVRYTKTEGGMLAQPILHTESLTEPVRFEDERMIFIVNDESIDITDLVSESRAFHYSYTDEGGIVHEWLVGKNGPELTNYGFAEYLRNVEEDWVVGYSARTNLDKDGKGPDWLQNGKRELNIPW